MKRYLNDSFTAYFSTFVFGYFSDFKYTGQLSKSICSESDEHIVVVPIIVDNIYGKLNNNLTKVLYSENSTLNNIMDKCIYINPIKAIFL